MLYLLENYFIPTLPNIKKYEPDFFLYKTLSVGYFFSQMQFEITTSMRNDLILRICVVHPL